MNNSTLNGNGILNFRTTTGNLRIDKNGIAAIASVTMNNFTSAVTAGGKIDVASGVDVEPGSIEIM